MSETVEQIQLKADAERTDAFMQLFEKVLQEFKSIIDRPRTNPAISSLFASSVDSNKAEYLAALNLAITASTSKLADLEQPLAAATNIKIMNSSLFTAASHFAESETSQNITNSIPTLSNSATAA